MKIGILTYHRAHNYGALLQAYALRQTLREAGHEVEFIDYWPKEHLREYRWSRIGKSETLQGQIINVIYFVMTAVRRWIRISRFKAFIHEILNLPNAARYTQKGSRIQEEYDVVVVGSDQIWRNYSSDHIHIGYDSVYFGQTLERAKRIVSYAASMGIIEYSEEEYRALQQWLRNFDAITVRELSLKRSVEQLGYRAQVVADPTLLLSAEKWRNFLPQQRYRPYSYVLYYEILPSQDAQIYAHQQAAMRHSKMLAMQSRVHVLKGSNEIQLADPLEFLQAIRDAEFVVCSSFHGTVFSILFEKQFVTMGLGKSSDRVETLLQRMGLEEHYLGADALKTAYHEIDYTKVKPLLERYRNESQTILLNSLTDKND